MSWSLRLLGTGGAMAVAEFGSAMACIERDGRPVERLTVGELLALVATASEVQA